MWNMSVSDGFPNMPFPTDCDVSEGLSLINSSWECLEGGEGGQQKWRNFQRFLQGNLIDRYFEGSEEKLEVSQGIIEISFHPQGGGGGVLIE